MLTKQITSYKGFIKAGRPYRPTLDDKGRLLLCNFGVNDQGWEVKHKNRLVINSGVLYNTGKFCAIWFASQSCQGFRWQYMYFRFNGSSWDQVVWSRLKWSEKVLVINRWHKSQDIIPIMYSPSKNWKRWLQ